MNPHGPTLLLASRNRKKCREIAELLAPHGIGVESVADCPDAPEVVEDGATFAENAAKKATETATALQRWTLGEDSGLEVDALGGAPGVYSARYAGQPSDDLRNNAKLIEALAGVPVEKRGARYVCHAAVADPQGNVRLQVEASCRGRIVEEARGTHGFGYDPHFLIPEYHRTFGELSPLVKQRLSHRARAFERLVPELVRLLK
ncbi:MAG: RdgB/HAM1 family non-canonical purine NTP pyrophosphatase [Planctomycetaceae bacterium]